MRSSGGIRRRSSELASLVVALVVMAACSSVVDGRANSIYSDPYTVAGLRITTGPSGARPGATPSGQKIENGDGGEIDELAANAVTDVETYWKETYSKLFNGPFTAVDKLVSYDSTSKSASVCGVNLSNRPNALYCTKGNYIAWDRTSLLPEIQSKFGDMGVVTVLAHEYGHAVQSHSRIISGATATIIREQQADCFAGSFIRTVAEGRSAHFTLNTSSGLNSVLAAVISVRDPLDTNPLEGGAHGSAFDRVNAFQFGFSDGPGRCTEINEAEVRSRILKLPTQFASADQSGDLPIDESTIDAVLASLKETFQPNNTPEPTISFTGSGTCADASATPPVSYCPASNTLTIDVSGLAERGKANQAKKSSMLTDSISGDFSSFVLLAARYTLSVQKGLGAKLDGALVGLRSACYAGGYAAARTGTAVATGKGLSLAPGDLDEAVYGLLTDGLAASDVNGQEAPSGFTRVQAFRTGVLDGANACATIYR